MIVNDTKTKLMESLAEIESASDQLIDAQQHLQSARSAETTAINRLNTAQKKFDELVQAIRESAPQTSDWSREKADKARQTAVKAVRVAE